MLAYALPFALLVAIGGSFSVMATLTAREVKRRIRRWSAGGAERADV